MVQKSHPHGTHSHFPRDHRNCQPGRECTKRILAKSIGTGKLLTTIIYKYCAKDKYAFVVITTPTSSYMHNMTIKVNISLIVLFDKGSHSKGSIDRFNFPLHRTIYYYCKYCRHHHCIGCWWHVTIGNWRANHIHKQPPPREYDLVVSSGELIFMHYKVILSTKC